MAPYQVTLANSEQVWENLYGKAMKRKVGTLKVGDRVRLNKNLDHLRKVIYRAGPKECLWCKNYVQVKFQCTK